jgi:hypothetical protein
MIQSLHKFSGLGLLLLAGVAVSPAPALAIVSDEVKVTTGTTVQLDIVRNDPSAGLEFPIGFARLSTTTIFGTTTSYLNFDATTGAGAIAASAVWALTGIKGDGTWDDATLKTWLPSVQGTAAELFLTKPGSPSSVSDVLLRFSVSVTGLGSGDAVLMISDPGLVAHLADTTIFPHLNTFSSVAETGALQDVTLGLYPTGVAPFTIQVLSAVPEPTAPALLLAGLGLVALRARRRR